MQAHKHIDISSYKRTKGQSITDLIQEIISKVGVNQEQAEGGLGAILTFAKDQLDGDTFSNITGQIGGASDIMAKFSSLSSGDTASGMDLGGLLGSATSALGINTGDLGGMASIISNLSSLDIDMETLKKFAPVISNFLEQKGFGDIASKITSLL